MNQTILWCIGSPILLDDGAGPALFAELEAFPAEGVTPVNCETTPENQLAPLRKNPPGSSSWPTPPTWDSRADPSAE